MLKEEKKTVHGRNDDKHQQATAIVTTSKEKKANYINVKRYARSKNDKQTSNIVRSLL